MYATTQNFIDAFGEREMIQLTNLYNPAATTIDEINLQRNQSKAFGIINGYIANSPVVAKLMPFAAPFPELLIGYELDITRYFADSIQARDDVRLRYEDAIRDLKAIGRSEMSLGLVNVPPEVLTTTDIPIVVAGVQTFTRELLADYSEIVGG